MVVWGCIVSLHLPLCATNPFRMKAMAAYTIPVNQTTTQSIDLQPFGSISNVRGIDVTATVIQQSDDALVRLIVEDYAGNEYLLLESYRMINDMDTIHFMSYCEETAVLPAIEPKILHIAVKGAKVCVHSLRYATTMIRPHPSLPDIDPNDKTAQALATAAKINQYNESHNLLWRADTTALALMNYTNRKRVLGLDSDSANCFGFEYYKSGIFEMGRIASSNPESPSQYIDRFDWRNIHGKNWITSIKNQGNSGMCYAFDICAAIESHINLYYNDTINLDLSEEDLAYYHCYLPWIGPVDSVITSSQHGYYGGILAHALMYAKQDGIVLEQDMPFTDNPAFSYPDVRPNFSQCIKIGGSTHVQIYQPLGERTKELLINNGPLVGGHNMGPKHGMCLVGYYVLHVGDTVAVGASSSGYTENVVIEEDSPYVERTCWIFKNSYGKKSNSKEDGYIHMVFSDSIYMTRPTAIQPTISYKQHICDEQVTDNDGDGFYYWGIGPKPPSCPEFVPDYPDGDDGDADKGPINHYGFPLSPAEIDTIYVSGNNLWNQSLRLNKNIVVEPNSRLIVSCNTYGLSSLGVSFTVRENSELVFMSGTAEDIILKPQAGSKIVIWQNATVNHALNKEFVVPLGAELIINGKFN